MNSKKSLYSDSCLLSYVSDACSLIIQKLQHSVLRKQSWRLNCTYPGIHLEQLNSWLRSIFWHCEFQKWLATRSPPSACMTAFHRRNLYTAFIYTAFIFFLRQKLCYNESRVLSSLINNTCSPHLDLFNKPISFFHNMHKYIDTIIIILEYSQQYAMWPQRHYVIHYF